MITAITRSSSPLPTSAEAHCLCPPGKEDADKVIRRHPVHPAVSRGHGAGPPLGVSLGGCTCRGGCSPSGSRHQQRVLSSSHCPIPLTRSSLEVLSWLTGVRRTDRSCNRRTKRSRWLVGRGPFQQSHAVLWAHRGEKPGVPARFQSLLRNFYVVKKLLLFIL